MPILRALVRVLLLAVLASACGTIPSSITINLEDNTQDVAAIVQATFQAMTAEAAGQSAPTSMPLPSATEPGSISGSLNYPSESLPAMYVTAFQVGTSAYKYVITNAGQPTYQIDGLAPGTYHIVAYTVGSQSFPAGLAGGYTQAVPCGLGANCTDHTLIDILVAAGQAVAGINPADWYLVEGAFPPFPGEQEGAEVIPPTPAALATGAITGSIMYPAEGIPSLRVVAFQVGGNTHFSVDTVAGQSSYTLEGLPPGTYHVVAYVRPEGGFPAGPAGGYSEMVPCGLVYGCNDHTLIDVIVTAGDTTSGVDPNDYYADPGTFPANPAP